jgi:hypothetical protein
MGNTLPKIHVPEGCSIKFFPPSHYTKALLFLFRLRTNTANFEASSAKIFWGHSRGDLILLLFYEKGCFCKQELACTKYEIQCFV